MGESIKQLKLKHLAPYLPYGLKMIYDIEMGSIWELDKTNINAITEFDKPILIPLSDLTKDLSIGNDVINFQSQFNQYDFEWLIISNNKRKLINSLDYFIVSKMFEYHFDVFGLIEQGLAIDINTLK